MKKIYIYFFVFMFLLSGCGKAPQAQNSSSAPQVSDEGQGDQSAICGTLCERHIQELCQDTIEEYRSSGINIEGTVMDEASCQLMCEAEWTEDIIACATDADDCAQLSDSEPYCTDIEEENEPIATDAGCSAACRKYGDCVKYGDDIAPEDVEAAYATCMEVCSATPSKVVSCINNYPIKKPSDCMLQSACVLPALNQMINR